MARKASKKRRLTEQEIRDRNFDPVDGLIKRAGAGKGMVLPPDAVATVSGTLLGLRMQIQTLEGIVSEYQRLLQDEDEESDGESAEETA